MLLPLAATSVTLAAAKGSNIVINYQAGVANSLNFRPGLQIQTNMYKMTKLISVSVSR